MAQLCGREGKESVHAKVPCCPPGPCQDATPQNPPAWRSPEWLQTCLPGAFCTPHCGTRCPEARAGGTSSLWGECRGRLAPHEHRDTAQYRGAAAAIEMDGMSPQPPCSDRAPSRSRGSHPRWAAAPARPQRRRLPTFRPSRRGGARTQSSPVGKEGGQSERPLSVLQVPSAAPDPRQGLTWRRPGPPSSTCPCSPQPATGAGPPSSRGGPALK